jgi:hypothetical protein
MQPVNLKVLTTTNERYIPVVSKLLSTFKEYHPEIQVIVSCVNVSSESIDKMKAINERTLFLVENYEFEKPDHEKNYCAHNRVWLMPNLMQQGDFNLLWLDADVYLRGNLDGFFEWLSNKDFAIRAKAMDPYRCNCGMVYVKNSDKNLKILNEWKEEAKKLNILDYWYADQDSLNKVMHNHINVLKDITYATFPDEYNGISTNNKSVIVHMKGPEKMKKLQ